MSGVSLTFGDQTESPAPYIFKWDYAVSWSGDPNYPSSDYPGHRDFFTTCIQQGEIMDVKPMLRSTFEDLKAAGVYHSQTYTACDYSVNGVAFQITYDLVYNPAQPFKLQFTPSTQGGYAVTPVTLDYSVDNEDQWQQLEHCFCWYMIKLANMPNMTYDGQYVVNLQMFRPSYNYRNVYTVENPPVPPTWLPTKTDTARYSPMSLYDPSPVDPALWGSGVSDDHIGEKANWLGVNTYVGTPSVAGEKTYWYFDTTMGDVEVNGEPVDFFDYEIPEIGPDDDDSTTDDWSDDFNKVPQDRTGIPNTPSIDALSTGFIHAYQLSLANALALSNYLLTDDFIENVKKLFEHPIDYIMGCYMLPIQPTGSGNTVIIGGVDTEIDGYKITRQFERIDCGEIVCPMKWRGFADFNPGTKISIYLPFIGIRQLDTDDVMGATLHLWYYVDVLSGACLALIDCDTRTTKTAAQRTLNNPMYHFNGNMGFSVPITNLDYSQKVTQMINGATQVISGAAAAIGGSPSGYASMGGGVVSLIQGAAMKPLIEKAGNLSAEVGVCDEFVPHLIIEYPMQSKPQYFNSLHGFASTTGTLLQNFSGYLEVDTIDLSGIPCTDSERDEILSLLRGGVFV